MAFYNKNEPSSIQEMFGSIAKQYDRTNSVLSLYMHKYWNNELVKHTLIKKRPKIFLDLCCGTGEIAFSFLKKSKSPLTAYLLDFCPEMLECAKAKVNFLPISTHEIHYIEANAQKIPLPDSSIDCATIAYGIRNVKEPAHCIADIFRVLKPNGTLGILELTLPENPVLKSFHKLYLKIILPLIGKILTSNKSAYKYLCQSIHHFVKPKELEVILKQQGFQNVQRISLMGGIATILLGTK